MGYYRKWTPSKTAKREFAQKMQEITEFCEQNAIIQSANGDSYYFTIDNQKYRVSNHTVEASNSAAFDSTTGTYKRSLYHPDGRKDDTVYIHAGKTRIIEIFNDLKSGYDLDSGGYRLNNNLI